MFNKSNVQIYPVILYLTIRSEGDTEGNDPEVFPKYYIYYKKSYDMPISPYIGLSFFIWKPIKIKDVYIRGNEVMCFLDEQILPFERFDELMKKYQPYLLTENWEENKSAGIRPR